MLNSICFVPATSRSLTTSKKRRRLQSVIAYCWLFGFLKIDKNMSDRGEFREGGRRGRGANQYILILRGSAGRKNAIFWSKFSKKCLKTPFLDCFFKFLPAAQKTWPKRTKPCLVRAQKINSNDLKKNYL